MLKGKQLTTMGLSTALIALITSSAVGTDKAVTEWLRGQASHIFFALVFAIVAGVIIHYVYIKIGPKSKILQNTITRKPKTVLAKFILPNNNEIRLTEGERIFGRDDFVGVISVDDLLFIGRKHFKIVKRVDGFCIEDLGTKNGTMLNGEEIKGLGRRKLEDGDKMQIANVLGIRYVAEP